jgi:hypothetical protein
MTPEGRITIREAMLFKWAHLIETNSNKQSDIQSHAYGWAVKEEMLIEQREKEGRQTKERPDQGIADKKQEGSGSPEDDLTSQETP